MMCPSDPHEAKTPPVVGWRKNTKKGRPAALWVVTARAMSIMRTKKKAAPIKARSMPRWLA